jgi:hypothetical protein
VGGGAFCVAGLLGGALLSSEGEGREAPGAAAGLEGAGGDEGLGSASPRGDDQKGRGLVLGLGGPGGDGVVGLGGELREHSAAGGLDVVHRDATGSVGSEVDHVGGRAGKIHGAALLVTQVNP